MEFILTSVSDFFLARSSLWMVEFLAVWSEEMQAIEWRVSALLFL